ncbi:hypothetical protein QH494_22915 [Sphingomonas sp. AR_OL41]|uniref:hypothetical protein n=1 Tax=Sphingomonas sp. AR_OL41 TaxID=3042729 RepID=UPI0024813CA1|nr:hypothetical protein [Sphingomonas sp. AR_OL41]MDH7975045.1 hypothetical protein [Sphingomonas sp. AR_OL41]
MLISPISEDGQTTNLRTSMKGTHFAVGLVASLCITVPLFALLAMPECQLSHTPSEIQACFDRVSFSRNACIGVMAVFLIASIVLHIRSSKGTPWTLVGLALAPWIVIFAT